MGSGIAQVTRNKTVGRGKSSKYIGHQNSR
jgi:hypothetical protein